MKLTIVIEGNKEDRTLQKALAQLNDFDVVSATWETEKVVPAFTHRNAGGGNELGDVVDGLIKGIGAVRGRGR